MTAKRVFVAAGGVLAALVLAQPAAGACQFKKIAEVPVTMDGLQPTIMVKINGQDAKFLVDTGAVFGGVTPSTVAQFNMKHSIAPFGLVVTGVGGSRRDAQAARADSFVFAGVGFHDTDFLVIGRVGANGVAGNIGENLMGPFDVEYDLANGVIRYFKPDGCSYDTNLAYWSQGKALSRLSIIEPTNILTKVITNAKVDGHTIKVKWDSGSWLSVLNRSAAGRAGIQINSEGVTAGGVSYGIAGRGIENFLAPFASFQIGDEEIKNTQLRVADLQMGDADMLLGADFFLSHRILVSNSQKRVYFTYNGGPVFKLDRPPQPRAPMQQLLAQAAEPAAAGEGTAAPDAAGPKTAADFARRGSAFAARREFLEAIADYTKAIQLEPDSAAHYRARAMVRLAARQPVLAMADLDEALKRQPNDPEALMRRGELYLTTRDPVRAKADFDAAMKLSPNDSSLIAQAGAAYARAGLYEPAIHELDTWIAAHAKDEDLPRAFTSRCYARATWGKELPTALADCDAAMRKDKTSEVMETRGLVLLRMGRLDEAIAQYTAAIKAQPRAAPALYGRGLAELKKGQKTEGDADVAAAAAIAPGLAAQFKRFGVAPETVPEPVAAKS
ncbi:MAG: aspartyl protease family protein [Phenylobacterium sp.]